MPRGRPKKSPAERKQTLAEIDAFVRDAGVELRFEPEAKAPRKKAQAQFILRRFGRRNSSTGIGSGPIYDRQRHAL